MWPPRRSAGDNLEYSASFDLFSLQGKISILRALIALVQEECFLPTSVAANEDKLTQIETHVTADLIALYRALGGGWSVGGGLESVAARSPSNRKEDGDVAHGLHAAGAAKRRKIKCWI